MSGSSHLAELYREHQTAQSKYAYFLLGVAAAAVAFAIQRTSGMLITWWLLPAGLAVVAWGLSFYFGCRHLEAVQSALFANFGLLNIQDGNDPIVRNHPQAMELANETIRPIIESHSNRAALHARWQFRMLVLGALLFLLWHVLVMYRLTF